MATAELHAHVHDEAGTAVIELAGDVDRNAEAALRRGVLAGRLRTVDRARLLRRRVHQLDGHRGDRRPAGARTRERPAAERPRADGALPPDLRDHQAGGLHDHPRREGSGMTHNTLHQRAAGRERGHSRHRGRDHRDLGGGARRGLCGGRRRRHPRGRAQLHRPRVHELGWDRAARDPARAREPRQAASCSRSG